MNVRILTYKARRPSCHSHPTDNFLNIRIIPMQPSTHDTTKSFTAIFAATGFVIALILSAPVYARHGGDNFGRPSATPTYNAWLAQSEAARTPTPLRQEASLDSVMTDAPDVAKSYQVKTLTPDYDRLLKPSR